MSEMVKEMNRSEMRIYNLQLKILGQKRFDKLLELEDWGNPVIKPKPRRIELNGRLKNHDADIDDEVIRVSKDFYKDATPKELNETLRHELAHAFLMDNCIPYKHNSRTWTRVTLALGVRDTTNYEWQYFCGGCTSWLQTHDKKTSWRCHRCGKLNVTKREYNKLKKIAALNSKLHPINIDNYQVFKDIKRRA
jgi:predicted SprT family Zn-dependent metalloprotease